MSSDHKEANDYLAILRPAFNARKEKVDVDNLGAYVKPVDFATASKDQEVKTDRSGFVMSTEEVQAMRADVSVAAYEPLQNLTYGLGGSPRPALIIECRDGTEQVFRDKNGAPLYEHVSSMRYVTSVPEGITESTATLPIHRDKSGKGSFGIHGLGMKNTVIYLADVSPRTEIEIHSTYTRKKSGRVSWVGRYSLADTTDEEQLQLNLLHVDLPRKDIPLTTVTINNPPREFYEATISSGKSFLLMNPNYRGGILVPGEGGFDNGIKHQALVGGLGIEVLNIKSIQPEGLEVDHAFVDGLRFKASEADWLSGSGRHFLNQYNFVGGSDEKTHSLAQIKRKRDSATVENLNNLPILLRNATDNGYLGSDFWVDTFEKMAATGNVYQVSGEYVPSKEIPFELGESREMFKKGKGVIEKAFDSFLDSHPEIKIIARDIKELNLMRETCKRFDIVVNENVILLNGLYSEVLDTKNEGRIENIEILIRRKIEDKINNAPPIEVYKEVSVREIEPERVPNIDEAVRLLGENYKNISLEFDNKEKKIIFEFDGRLVNPLLTPAAINLALLENKPLFELMTSVLTSANLDDKRSIKVIRSDSFGDTGVEIKLDLILKASKNGQLTWEVSGDARKTVKSPSSAKLTFEIPIDPSKFAEFSKLMATNFEEGKSRKIKRDNKYQADHEKMEQALSEKDEEIKRLGRQNKMLMEAIKADPELSKDKAVQAALREVQQKEEEIKALKRENLIKTQEEIELRTAQFSSLRAEVWKMVPRVALGGGAFVVSKEFLLPWVVNSGVLQNGAMIVQGEVRAIADGLNIPTILGSQRIENVPGQGIGLTWSMGDSIFIDADNEPTAVNHSSLLSILKADGQEAPVQEEGAREIGYKVIPLVTIEGNRPGVDTSGYYFTSYANNLVLQKGLDGGFVRGNYVGDLDYQSKEIPNSRPSDYLLRQVYTPNMPERVWTPVGPRVGEMPVGFAGVQTAEFRQSQTTGVWEVKMTKENSKSLILYTGPANEESLSYLKRKPDDKDLEPLLEFNTLRSDIRGALQAVKDDPNLTQDEKTEEALAIFRATMKYDRLAPKKDFSQTNTKEYVSDMINQGIGPCGYFSLGAAAVLREVGTPCNSVGGFVNESFGEELDPTESHGWDLVWNFSKEEWQYTEPQIGITTQRYNDEKHGFQTTVGVETNTNKSETQEILPISVGHHLTDNPEPKYASLINGIKEITGLNRDTVNLPGLDNTVEIKILQKLAADETRRRVMEGIVSVAPVVASVVAPAFVNLVRQTIQTKRRIREEVDEKLRAENTDE